VPKPEAPLRDESGDVLQARQVSTQPEKVQAFFQQLARERLDADNSFIAVLEVCGFNDWLICMLQEYRCHKVILIQPDDRKKCKTDRRDAATLSELLWVNRDRLLQGKPIRGLRQVDIASGTDQENRLSADDAAQGGRPGQDTPRQPGPGTCSGGTTCSGRCPPSGSPPSKKAIAWLKQVALAEIDRLEMDHLLADLERVQQRLKELEGVIAQRCGASKEAALIATMTGVSHFTATALACRVGRVGRVERFPRAHSLANYWGLTPGCRNKQRREQPAAGEHHQGRQRHGPVAFGAGDAQGAAQGRPAAGVVQADQAPQGVHDRPRRRDAQVGHDPLAHAEQTHDLRRVPGPRGGRNERKGEAKKVWING
jgi:transposase